MGERLIRRVLFIGNSYTQGLRSVLATLFPVALQGSILVEFVTQGGRTLSWHWQHEYLKSKIMQGQWDYVVLQEQSQIPTLQGTSHYDDFLVATQQFCQLIKASGAIPVMFMTWGAQNGDRQHLQISPNYTVMQERLSQAYRGVALANQAELVPVGEAWAYVRQQPPEWGNQLYQHDGHHPSVIGNYLSAGMFCRYFWDIDAFDNITIKLDSATKALLRAAIASTLQN